MYRPLTKDDFAAMHHRMTAPTDSYTDCYIPVREDVELTNGTIIKGMMSWGHPDAYKFIRHSGQVYAVRKWDIGRTDLLG